MKVCGLFSEVKAVGGLTLAALDLMSSVLNPGCRLYTIQHVCSCGWHSKVNLLSLRYITRKGGFISALLNNNKYYLNFSIENFIHVLNKSSPILWFISSVNIFLKYYTRTQQQQLLEAYLIKTMSTRSYSAAPSVFVHLRLWVDPWPTFNYGNLEKFEFCLS